MSVYSKEFVAHCIDVAGRYRAERGKREGLVIVVPPCGPAMLDALPPAEIQFNAVGWINTLRDPSGWEPGVIAVTADGEAHEAVGGNYEQGAQAWELIETKQDAPA